MIDSPTPPVSWDAVKVSTAIDDIERSRDHLRSIKGLSGDAKFELRLTAKQWQFFVENGVIDESGNVIGDSSQSIVDVRCILRTDG